MLRLMGSWCVCAEIAPWDGPGTAVRCIEAAFGVMRPINPPRVVGAQRTDPRPRAADPATNAGRRRRRQRDQ
eukprot:9960134-Alexandrium_andersonii.AAC.1